MVYHSRNFLFSIGLSIALVTLPVTALAHKLSVFAWVEGNTVHMQSKFFGGNEVKNGRVHVLDAAGNLLLEGQTDAGGEFSFDAPVRTEMKIVVFAGMGHQADWTVKADDFEDMEPAAQRDSEKAQELPRAPASAGISSPGTAVAGVDSNEIRTIVEKALDKKLNPVIKMLSESREHTPGVSEILGGIGYIIGLVGLAAYIGSRRKKDSPGK